MLIFAADVRDTVATAGRYQVDVHPDVDCTRLQWTALRDRVFGVTDAHSEEGRRFLHAESRYLFVEADEGEPPLAARMPAGGTSAM